MSLGQYHTSSRIDEELVQVVIEDSGEAGVTVSVLEETVRVIYRDQTTTFETATSPDRARDFFLRLDTFLGSSTAASAEAGIPSDVSRESDNSLPSGDGVYAFMDGTYVPLPRR